MKNVILIVLILFSLDVCKAEISLQDLLSIDPKELLTAPPISDANKRLLIDCLNGVNTTPNCPDLPTSNALNKLRDLILQSKQINAITGLFTHENSASLLTGPSETADSLLQTFEDIKLLYQIENGGLPVDPYKDISDYLVSNAEVRVDLIGALKTRYKLRDTFSSTNDDILRKYASNYNVLIPHTTLIGLLRMIIDVYK